jgi:ribose 5-phosphate isomerase A
VSGTPAPAPVLRMKQNAALQAAGEVEDGMRVGLGSGSTAELAVEALAARCAAGLRISAIASSPRTADLARRLRIPLTVFAKAQQLDLTIDGADQVERGSLALVKGLGGALLREKIVAGASGRLVIVVDQTKLVEQLGGTVPLPVEIVPFGRQWLLARLTALGAAPELRQKSGKLFRTADGNFIADCKVGPITDAAALQTKLLSLVGVVETGLFLGMASKIVIGLADGVEVLKGPRAVA